MKKWMVLCLAVLIALPGTATTSVFADGNESSTTSNSNSSTVTNDTYSSGTPVNHIESTNNSSPTVQSSKPVITLIGSSQIQLPVGYAFSDPGVTVQGDVYQDLKPTITYTLNNHSVASVDTNTQGTYIIHYNVTNPEDQSADEVTRTVVVATKGNYIDLATVNLSGVYGMAYHGDYAYVAQRYSAISQISLYTGKVTPVVTSQTAFMAVALNSAGDLFYTIDSDQKIYKLDHQYLTQLPLSEADFNAKSTVFYSGNYNYLYGLAIDSKDNLYFSDYTSKSVLKIADGTTTPVVVLSNFTTSFTGFGFDTADNLYMAGDNSKVYLISQQNLSSLPVDSSHVKNLTPDTYVTAYGLVFLSNGDSYIGSAGKEPIQKSPLVANRPEIQLLGSSLITLNVGESFTDPGTTVFDNVYSNLTATATYTLDGVNVASVDTNTAGTYVIHYNVTNPAQLSADEVTRTVIVKALPTKLSEVDVNRPFGMAYHNGDVYYADYDRGIYKISTKTFKLTQIAKGYQFVGIAVNANGDLFYSTVANNTIYKVKAASLNGELPLTADELKQASEVYYAASIDTTQLVKTAVTGLSFDHQDRLYATITAQSSKNAFSKIIRLSGDTNLITEEIAQYPTAVFDLSFAPSGNLYVNVGDFHTYKLPASYLKKLPAQVSDFKDMGANDYSYGLMFLPDAQGYVSHVEPGKKITPLSFLDEAEPVSVTGITLDTTSLNLKKKGASQKLTATIAPANANNKALIWISSNPAVATVQNGVVTPVSKGTALIKVITADGNFSADATVIVKEADSSSGSSSSSSQNITLNVDDGKGKTTIPATAIVTRTTQTNGQKQDSITFTTDKVKEAIATLKNAAEQTVRLVVPDANDEVAQTDITLPATAAKDLRNADMNLEISTNDAKVSIPASSLNSMTSDLYFHFVPIKTTVEQNAVATRAKQENIVKEALGDGDITVIGRPMTIETNLQNQPVQLVMPIDNSVIPQDATLKTKWLNQLRIFIEHSDGDRELVQPSVVDYGNGETGLQFNVTKFSTFTIVDMQKLAASTTTNPTGSNVNTDTTAGVVKPAYIQGYPDQTFRPNNSITRAEMASLLYRLQASAPNATTSGTGSYSDVSSTFWAHQAIASMQSTGLMKGLTNGKFAPAQPITRAEMAAIVSRWQGLTGTGSSFANDINDHWAVNDIKRVTTAGLMQGVSPSSFQPDQPLTRAQAVTILNKILEKSANLTAGTKAWKDVPSSHWAYADIMEASNSYTLK